MHFSKTIQQSLFSRNMTLFLIPFETQLYSRLTMNPRIEANDD
jgi:hypothetical protein